MSIGRKGSRFIAKYKGCTAIGGSLAEAVCQCYWLSLEAANE